MTQRYKLTIAYRGTRYHGWQTQPAVYTWKGPTPLPGHGIPTIQEILARAIQKVIGHPIRLVGSSRTDSGVHAKGQVAHFDMHQARIPPDGLRRAVNFRIPDDILIRTIEPVDAAFDAISDTVSKRYQYFVWNALDRPVFFPDMAFHRWKPLDIPAMSRAARSFIGTHDFAAFAKPGHGRQTTIRTVLDCSVSARGPRVVIGMEGNGFLWNQVRIMAGTLIEIGLGQRSPDEIPVLLTTTDRTAAGSTAPPHGLFLQWIRYSKGAP
jgi:tRNA pseudouridine38-40 synthase